MTGIRSYDLWIAGRWARPATGKSFERCSPSTGRPVAKFALAGPGDLEDAAAAAHSTFLKGTWSRIAASTRSKTLNRLADLIEAICDSSFIDMISFTGSTRVGRLIAARASARMKKIALELGGKGQRHGAGKRPGRYSGVHADEGDFRQVSAARLKSMETVLRLGSDG